MPGPFISMRMVSSSAASLAKCYSAGSSSNQKSSMDGAPRAHFIELEIIKINVQFYLT